LVLIIIARREPFVETKKFVSLDLRIDRSEKKFSGVQPMMFQGKLMR